MSDPTTALPTEGRRLRVVAAMSGGVDSAVAAARMIDAGHEVTGVHLALSQSAETLRESARGCCTLEDAGDARRVADALGIPFYVWDMAERFRRDVIEDFVAEYEAGRTPNPCLRCNESIKFAALLDKAVALGFDAVATGHYAQIVEVPDPAADGGVRRELHRAVDAAKDQSYVLGVLDSDQLARAHFPLGDTTKPQIREEAARRGFSVARKPDSHDICFIADGDTRAYLAERLGERPGDIVDPAGQVLGAHGGAHGYTVGQRKGLGLRVPADDGAPRYVLRTDPATNQVVVGPKEMLGVDVIRADHVRWCGPAPEGQARLGAQIRAHGAEYPARVAVGGGDASGSIVSAPGASGSLVNGPGASEPGDGEPEGGQNAATAEHQGVTVFLEELVRGVAPGQSVVLYDGTRVVGSATITSTDRSRVPERAHPGV